MKGIAFLPGFISVFLSLGIILPASSQVTSDNSTNTTVNTNDNNFHILNGIQKGNNLFHSFKEFSIPKGGSAIFNNSNDIVNIINRVTGGNISNIDGLIKASGNANLFLINPKGIVFGENARLDIGGSFLGSTAESILFEDGFEFSTVNPPSKPLLTISVPIGLQMGMNPGDIRVKGNGHNQIYENASLIPFNRSTITPGLQVSESKAISLIGGNIFFDRGVLSAPGGRIELGAVGKNNTQVVNINSTSTDWRFNYENINEFGDIQLNGRSVVDASGAGSGSISLQGKKVELNNASAILIQNIASVAASGIEINATESLVMQGNSFDGLGSNTILTESFDGGKGGDITIETQQLTLLNGAQISTQAFGSAPGGDLKVRSSGIELSGFAPSNLALNTGLGNTNFGTGSSGNVFVSSNWLKVTNGAAIPATTFGEGDGGNMVIQVRELIEISGVSRDSLFSSLLVVSAFGSGDAGDLTVNAGQIKVSNGGLLASTTLASGNAGNLTINASESVEITGQFVADSVTIPSRISAASEIGKTPFLQALGLPPLPTGESGNLSINTPALHVLNGGIISVLNDGTAGNAGNLEINSNFVTLDNKGALTAIAKDGEGGDIILSGKTLDIRNGGSILTFTQSGNGGNINLNMQELLLMRKQSLIDTESLRIGNGGNITIKSPIITGLENSDIIANAVQGNGGNINITTQGIFGLKFSEQLTSESDITASSEFGLNGQVMLEQLDFNPVASLIELPSNFRNTTQVKSGCRASRENKFVVLGRGVPQNPSDLFDGNRILVELLPTVNQGKISSKNSSARVNRQADISSSKNSSARVNHQKEPIIEATGFIRNSKGEIELVAGHNKSFQIKAPGCS